MPVSTLELPGKPQRTGKDCRQFLHSALHNQPNIQEGTLTP